MVHICEDNIMMLFPSLLMLNASRFRGNVTWYTVNLNLPPSERWTQVIKDKNKEVSNDLNNFDL